MLKALQEKSVEELLILSRYYNISPELSINNLLQELTTKIGKTRQIGRMNGKTLDISNKGITSLKEFFATYQGNPDEITELWCNNNQLTTLEGCPQNVRELYCIGNQLTTLQGCSPRVESLDCSNNNLMTFEGCLPNVDRLVCDNNQLTTLKGCPPNVKILYCYNNQLTTLEGCPPNVQKLSYSNNPLNPEWQHLSLAKIKENLREIEDKKEKVRSKISAQIKEFRALKAELEKQAEVKLEEDPTQKELPFLLKDLEMYSKNLQDYIDDLQKEFQDEMSYVPVTGSEFLKGKERFGKYKMGEMRRGRRRVIQRRN